ncbi:MAG TPA: serine/threonine-protein kinase [Gemmataceae bacterium]|nr:serine/threonine-protein kinase [Gemmataceae bacterium]
MSTPALAPPTPDWNAHSTRVWVRVSEHLEAFARAWDSAADPPDPAAFLPADMPEARRLALIEIIKLDLDYRLQRGLSRPLEDYLRAFPELAEGGLPCDLLYEDFHLRRQAGEAVTPSEYYRRFPAAANDLARLLGGTATARSTCIAPAGNRIALGPGDRLDEFDLLTLLGEGHFAKVFLARQRGLQRLVALKVSSARGAEAATLAQLEHPNIVRVYDQRTLADRGLHLVYMSYLPGGTLQNVLDRARTVPADRRSGRTLLESVDAVLTSRGETPPAESAARAERAGRSWPATVCALGAKLASALDHAHSQRVLHRDVKPANVLLTAEGEPLLADFNVGCCSKLEGAGPAAYFGGSLPYMAPEHLEAFNPAHSRPPESLDGRADVFSLAVTLWELLAGARPFREELSRGAWGDMLDELVAVRKAGPTRAAIDAWSEGDVPGLKAVLLRCLDPDPDRRPATAGEMARELDLCLNPRARDLIHPPPGGWRHAVRRWPMPAVLLAALIPNLLAGAYNFEYNRNEIISHLPDAKSAFWLTQGVINAIAFPVGLVLVGWLTQPVARAMRGSKTDDPQRVQDRCLSLGHWAAGLSIAEWGLAGLAYPISIRALTGHLPADMFVHFLMSLILCGLFAAAYPFFMVSFLAVRVFYPALPLATTEAGGPARLERLARQVWPYLLLTAAVPVLSLTIVVLAGPGNRVLLAIFGTGGLIGFAVAFWLARAIQEDLAALSGAMSPKSK